MLTLAGKISKSTTTTRARTIQCKARAVAPPKVTTATSSQLLQRKETGVPVVRSMPPVSRVAVSIQQSARQTLIQQKAQAIFSKAPSIQTKLEIGKANDHFEAEADAVADRVMSIPDSALQSAKQTTTPSSTKVSAKASGISRSVIPLRISQKSIQPKIIQRQSAVPSAALQTFNIEGRLNSTSGRGSPLDPKVAAFMEPRFGVDFGNVQVHTGAYAAQMNNALGSHAFAYSNNIYFNQGQYQPNSTSGLRLIAHELTHVVQQGTAIRRKADPTVNISQQTSPVIQGLGMRDALNFFANAANNIPGFTMLTFIIGMNPINGQAVPRNATNLFRAIIGFMPGGNMIFEALQNHGIIDRVGNWAQEQLATLGMAAGMFRTALNTFLDSLSWSDIFDLDGVWERAKRIFTEPIDRIISFIGGLVSGIIRFIKEAILRPLAALAEGTRGYDLLKAVLGQDPVTGDPVPRTAETLIGGFMRLIGQEEIWTNIQNANAIPRAWAWFQGALGGLMGFVRQIPGLFITAFQSLQIADIILVPRAFARIASVFGSFIGSFLSWAGNTIWDLLQIIFSVVAPGVMPYIQRAAGAFRTILRNPIGFVRTLVQAALLGFRQFGANFLRHLRTSLIQWLTGALPGVYIPQALNIMEIIKFVLSVLGLTWQNIRGKLVRAIGETAVAAMETGFDIVATLVTQGPAAAWDKIREAVSNLQQMVIDGVLDFVKTRIVDAALTRLLSMLTPAGAFIQAIIAIYNTVMFFVERLRQIAQVAAAFIDSISAIANGVIAAAANRVEQTMAGLLTLVISFLARIAGLGRVSDAVMNIINRVRQPIDRALDRVVDWIVNMARRLGRFVANAASRVLGFIRPKPFSSGGESHRIYADPTGNVMVASDPERIDRAVARLRRRTPPPDATILSGILTQNALLEVKVNAMKAPGVTDAQKTTLQTEADQIVDRIVPLFVQAMNTGSAATQQTMTKVTLTFTYRGNKGEYDRQLRMQQQVLTNLTIAQWLPNRARFVVAGRDERTDTTATRRAALQARARANPLLVANTLIGQNVFSAGDRAAVTNIINNTTLDAATKAQRLVPIISSTIDTYDGQRLAVLHTLDQVAGGNPTNYGDDGGIYGDTNVNSHIGTQWQSRVRQIDAAIRDVVPTAALNVELTT
ncbi:MAG: DUF4157 domain-containing protein [Filimonas sp.]|nr:DUF4157 domain-containing protein [Filimonas sp.]